MRKSILFLVAMLFVVGCSDKKEEKKVEVSKAAGSIEVVANKDYKSVKVKELETKNLKAAHKDKGYYFDQKSIKDKTYTPIEANMRVRTPYEKLEVSLLVNKLSKKFIVKCSACHNDYANGIIGPSLLSKSKESIYNSIMEFKTKKRTNVLMTDLVKMMSKEEISELAGEIANFNSEIRSLKEKIQ